jgi:hypothetical protein
VLTKKKKKKEKNSGQALVDHACNPSYLGGRDQEDQGFLKKIYHKEGLVEWLKW